MVELDGSRPQAVFHYNGHVWWKVEELTRAELAEFRELWERGKSVRPVCSTSQSKFYTTHRT